MRWDAAPGHNRLMGKITQSYTRDYLIAGDDRGQSVLYTSVGGVTFTVNAAIYEELTVDEASAGEGGYFGEADRRWTMGKAEFDAVNVTPAQGDSFTDESDQLWTIPLEVVLDPLELVYLLHTRRGR